MHAEQDYTSFVSCQTLQGRGFTVFCANNDASKSGYMSDLNFEDMMTNVNRGMTYLRNLTDIDKVVMLGHSGGGTMMAAYQDIAEDGASACQGSEKIYHCSSAMDDLEPADGLMLLAANYGISTMTFLSLNPAFMDGSNASKINQSLNVFNPNNGFNNITRSNYTAEFKKAFQAGAVARNNRIIKYAGERLVAIEAGNSTNNDDEPFTIPAIADQWEGGALKTTIKRYLSIFAIRVGDDYILGADGIDGIDYASSNMAPLASIKGVTVPLLTMSMTGHYDYLNAEKLHLNAGSNDTAIAFVEGAQDTINTSTAYESYPG
ncbi:uncharacterized protein N7443_005126 [Penicillium atrosanguineum]|uniref:uncharacterized protein n=1 Tax=Penicillium atrosanguineum TaxID=1132637 RepID=UPI00239EF6F5|nr:uncharacterized protein N7443_005126 [Penicillium atrosanguineum]KAJ5305466.1 hypothetical protein N7443_005126 [Penicillium atrosanguineum]